MARRLTPAERLMAEAAKRRAASAERATICSVPCPVCSAGPGKACRDQRGAFGQFHGERRHAAGHALIELEDIRKQPRPRPRTVPPSTRPAGRSKRSRSSANGRPSWALTPSEPQVWQLPGTRVKRDVKLSEADSPFRLSLIPRAYEALVDLAALSADGRETGGIALGFYDAVSSIVVTDVAGPGAAARRAPLGLVPDGDHDQAVADAVAADGRELIELASWHTHPGSASPRPSGQDLQRGAGMLLVLERRHSRLTCFTELIVTPGREHGWRKPAVGAWVTRRDLDRGRFVTEPAALRGAGQ